MSAHKKRAEATEPPKRNRGGRKPGRRSSGIDLVETVVQLLTDQIVAGAFGQDGRLPAEGELQQRFEVSRTVVREAMRILRVKGLVEMSQGKLARVLPPDPGVAVESLELLFRRNEASLLHLAEIRQPLEAEIAGLAAERADAVHLRRLQEAVDAMARATRLDERIEKDLRFHHILAEATGNPLFVALLDTLAVMLRESRRRTLSHSGLGVALTGHREILAAVRARDSEAARKAMRDHLRLATRDLSEAAEQVNRAGGVPPA